MSEPTGHRVVLLPGSLCDERLFTHQLAALSDAGHDVSVAELRPHISIESMAAHVAEAVDDPFVAIGLSLGGIVAAELIAQCPDRLLGVGLLNTNLAAPTTLQIEQRRQWEATVRTGKLWQLVVQDLIPVLSADPERHGQLIFAMAETASSAGFISENQALLHRHDRRPLLETFDRPVLALCGEEDTVCPPVLHREFAERASHSRLEIVADAGHLSTIDQPAAVSDLLIDWLNQISHENHFQEGNHAYDHA
ncbi:MAG: alpha/beta hydrolase [Actinomycetota bacterium]